MTSQEISRIHSKKLATKNKRYYSDDGKLYIGTASGHLRLVDSASTIEYRVQGNTTTVQKKIQSITETIDGVNASAVFTYDSEGNITKKQSYTDSSLSILINTSNFTYDSDGNLIKIQIEGRENVVKTFNYDSSNNLTSKFIA